MDTKQFVEQALAGDQEAWNALYQKSYAKIHYTCMGFLKNEADAKDITQDTYLSALEHLGELREKETFETWLVRIAINKCKNFLKQRNRFVLSDEVGENDGQLSEDIDENILPPEYAEQKEKRQIVMKIMEKELSDVLYQTAILFYFDELTIPEIAEFMECPEGTVKYRLSVARQRIRDGVLSYENKTGEKLLVVGAIPFLALLFKQEVSAMEVTVPPMAQASDVDNVVQSTAENNAGNTTENVAANGMLMKTKIIIAAAAVVCVGAAVGIAAAVSGNRDKDDRDTRDQDQSETKTASTENFAEENVDDTVNNDDDYMDHSLDEYALAQAGLRVCDSGVLFSSSMGSENYFDYYCIIENTTEERCCNPQILGTVKNEDGEILTDFSEIGGYIMPDDRALLIATFAVDFSYSAEDLDITYNIEYSEFISAEENPAPGNADLRIEHIEDNYSSSSISIKSEVTSLYDDKLDYLQVYAILRKDGEVVCIGDAIVYSLNSGDTKSISHNFTSEQLEFDEVEYMVYEMFNY